MNESIDLTGIRNTAEYVYMGRIRQNTGRGRYLALLILVIGGVIVALFASPASAQQPIVTPYPGPIATATAAAQAASAAEAQRAEGARLIQQGREAQALADEQIRAAQQAANEARAALQAQQYQAALDAVSRAETSVGAAQAQINALRASGDDVRGILDAQTARIISQTLELQQLRTDKQTIYNAYIAATSKQAESSRSNSARDIFTSIVTLCFLLVIVAWLAQVMRRRRGATVVTVIDEGGKWTE